jgi:hypothetical protein
LGKAEASFFFFSWTSDVGVSLDFAIPASMYGKVPFPSQGLLLLLLL